MNTKTRAHRKRDGESGFTLIEVMVVVLIIGILLAIGVPTFLGARTRAQDRAAQTSLRIAQSSAMVIFTDNSTFKPVDPSTLTATEPSIKWLDAGDASPSPEAVSILVDSETDFYAASMSASGTCFTIHLDAKGTTGYGRTGNACDAKQALTSSKPGWTEVDRGAPVRTRGRVPLG